MGSQLVQNTTAAEDAPQPPLKEDNTLYPYCMFYEGDQSIAYADTPEELLEFLIPGYLEKDETGRLESRILLAHAAQVRVQAVIVAESPQDQLDALSDTEKNVLLGSRATQPHGWGEGPMGDVWDSEIPLILVESAYAPYSDIDQPISGIADVIDPPNIIWLRTVDEWEFLVSLSRCGFVNLKTATDV